MLRAAFLWLAAMALMACSRDAGPIQRLPTWQLVGCDGKTTPLELPAHLDHLLPAAPCTYSLETPVTLESRLQGASYLTIVRLPTKVRLQVDGQFVPDAEQTLLDGYRTHGYHSFQLPQSAPDRPLRLRLIIEHTWFQAAWLDGVPVLTKTPYALSVLRFNRYVPPFAVGVLVAIALVFVLLSALSRDRPAYGWFAAGALSASSYPLFEWGVLREALGTYEAAALGMLLPVAPVALVRCTHEYFRLEKPSRWWDVSPLLALVLVLRSPAPFGPGAKIWVGYTIATVVVGIGYNTLLLLRLTMRKQRPRNAEAFLACWLFLCLTAWSDLVVWAGFGEVVGGVRPTSLGLTLFGLLQALILGNDFLSLNTELRARVDELETRRVEIDHLNQELRRQIADRSEMLVAALSQLDAREQARATPLGVGEIVQGRYRVLNTLGSGGMGTVLEVERLSDGAHFAMKVSLQRRPEALAALAREAKIATRAQHPNIVRIVDFDVSSAGFLYLVLELVHGAGLHRQQAKFGDVRWALDVLRQIAEGMRALHAVGVVHRDLKPANILISARDAGGVQVKLADFGISNLRDGSPSNLPPPPTLPNAASADLEGEQGDDTRVLGPPSRAQPIADEERGVPMLVGTPLYMAPELIHQDGRVSGAADVYAFGVISWQLLTGALPFLSSAALRALQGLPPEPPGDLRSRLPEVDPGLCEALNACLAPSPEARPTPDELVRLLERAATHFQGKRAMG